MDNIYQISYESRYKKLNTALLFLLFFVEVIDNYLRELKIEILIIKYSVLFVFLIICALEYLSIRKRNKSILKLANAYRNIIIICCSFFALTVFYCIKNNGYTISTITALLKLFLPVFISFVVVNTVSEKQIYKILVCYLVLSFVAYILTVGLDKFTINNFLSIDFIRSFSPFESNFFSPSALGLFLYFVYNNKKIWTIVLSALFVVLTFKRFMIVAMVITLILAPFVTKNKSISKSLVHLLAFLTVIGTWIYMLVMEGVLDDILIKYIGMDMNKFTMGRGWLFENLKYHFVSYGFGSAITQVRSIEMDLLAFYMEMGVLSIIVFIFCLYSIGNCKLYCIYIISIVLVELMTSHFYDISFFWIIFYMTISCAEHGYRNLNSLRKKRFRIGLKQVK